MKRHRKIALLIEWSHSKVRGLPRGIATAAKAYETWKIYQTERRLCDAAPYWLQDWSGEGTVSKRVQ